MTTAKPCVGCTSIPANCLHCSHRAYPDKSTSGRVISTLTLLYAIALWTGFALFVILLLIGMVEILV